MIGRAVAHYKVVEKLGEGGMGEVYLARVTKLLRDVALKILSRVFARGSQHLAHFEREVLVLVSLGELNYETD